MEVNTQIEDNCRRTIFNLQGYSCLKKASVARNWVIRNLRRILFGIQAEQLYAEWGARLNNFYLLRLLCTIPSLFAKNLNKAGYNIYGNLLPVFLALRVPVLRRNKATNSTNSTDPFSAATKTLVLGHLLKFLKKDLQSHSHRHFAIGDNEKNKTIFIIIFFIFIARCQTCDVKRMWCQV